MNRNIRQRRAQVVVELDRALGAARLGRPAAADPARVEVGLLAAGRRLTRHGPLRTAGELPADQVPKGSTEHLDLVRCLDDLAKIYDRDAASLKRRGVGLTGVYMIFVSTAAPLADAVLLDQVERLSQLMHIWWILSGNAWQLLSGELAKVGVQTFEEHADVANELVATAISAGAQEDAAAAQGANE